MGDIASSNEPIQQPSVNYNNPASEAALSAIGGVANLLLSLFLPVGSILESMLNETQFLDQIGNPTPQTWVLADGRDVTGSTYNALTGNTSIPDLRGLFMRGLNNGGSAAGTRSDGYQNPDGNSYVAGVTETFKMYTHKHDLYGSTPAGSGPSVNYVYLLSGSYEGGTEANYESLGNSIQYYGVNGGNEEAPTNVSVNRFIRIN